MATKYINKIKIKEKIPLKLSSCYFEGLDEKVKLLIEESVERAEANNRRTVYKKDL